MPSHPGSTVVWNTPATVTAGASNAALMIKYPSGETIPVSVPFGLTALQFAASFDEVALEGYAVQAARLVRDGVAYESALPR